MTINSRIFKNKKIIVTGGTGSIGSEIVRQLLKFDVAQVRVFSRSEHRQYRLINELGRDKRLRFLLGDVRDKERMDNAFQDANICYHAAALKQVPICEYNPYEAVKTNIFGSQNVIELAIKHNLEKVVAISTDKAVDPHSVLGASKLMMEKLMTAARHIAGKSATIFAVVRFGNVLESRGSVGEIWKRQILNEQPVTVTDPKMTRFFMETREAVNLILKATELMRGEETFVLKMKKMRVLDLAKQYIAKYAPGKKIPIKITGRRPGERLYEKLLTEEEAKYALGTKDMFILPPQILLEFAPERIVKYPYRKFSKKNKYRSDK